jgi:hypothetical protein
MFLCTGWRTYFRLVIFSAVNKISLALLLGCEVLRALLAQGSRTYGVPVWVVSGDTGVAAGTLLR